MKMSQAESLELLELVRLEMKEFSGLRLGQAIYKCADTKYFPKHISMPYGDVVWEDNHHHKFYNSTDNVWIMKHFYKVYVDEL